MGTHSTRRCGSGCLQGLEVGCSPSFFSLDSLTNQLEVRPLPQEVGDDEGGQDDGVGSAGDDGQVLLVLRQAERGRAEQDQAHHGQELEQCVCVCV